jgi:CheY-like chemotaxis protein
MTIRNPIERGEGIMKILIVDDKAENIYMLETLLKAGGYKVISAANGKEALEKLRTETVGMIISDILMPVMDGFQLCQEVRADETLKHIPFIFYTGTYTDEKDEELALKIGADKFLRKPMEPDEFIKIIQGVFRDAEEGKFRPQEPALRKTEETFQLYSERLVKKLEKKMLDLEKEILERERAEERVKHLNLVLVAIRKVNQLIVHEKDTDRLLQGVCDNLIENRGYYNAWIALLDDTGGLVATAESGLGKDFLPIVKLLKSGKMTDCMKRAQMQSGIVVTKDPHSTCSDCPLVKRYRGRAGFTARLEHDGKMYGLLTVSIPEDFAADEEEQSLFGEVAGDIGYALHNMELEEKRKRAEEELEKHKGHLEGLVRKRTDELQKMVNLMAGREVRMAELKETIRKLRSQLEEAGMTPVADDPLKEGGRLKSDF